MEGFIIAALTSLIISAFAALFRKSKTKLHAKTKFMVMLILEIILLPAVIGVAAIDPMFVTPTLIVGLPLCCIVGYKMYKFYQQIKNNDYEQPENNKEDGSISNMKENLLKKK